MSTGKVCMCVFLLPTSMEPPGAGYASSHLDNPGSSTDLARIFTDALKQLFGNTSWNLDFGKRCFNKDNPWMGALHNRWNAGWTMVGTPFTCPPPGGKPRQLQGGRHHGGSFSGFHEYDHFRAALFAWAATKPPLDSNAWQS